MNINQLRYFIAIVENRSFRSASDVLNVSQPALSNSIKALEDLLQVQLLDRGNHGVLPTAYGKVLYQFFKSAVQTIERGSQEVESMRDGSKGHVNIGAPTGIIDLFLPKIIERVSELQPGISYGVQYGYLDTLVQALRYGDLDFLITPYWPDTLMFHGLEVEELIKLHVSIYARSAHPLSEKQNVTLDDLLAANWIFADSEGTKLFKRQLFGEENLQSVNCVITHNYPPFMNNILCSLDLLTIMPDYVVSQLVASGSIKKIQYADFNPFLPAGIIRLKSSHITPSMQLFADQARDFMKALTTEV